MNCFCQYDFDWTRDCPRRRGRCLGAFSLFYPIRVMQAEVKKRTAYIGRYREDDAHTHHLDISLLDEEAEDMFIPYLKAAMADVFDVLQVLAKHHPCAYLWNEGRITIPMQEVVSDSDEMPEPIVIPPGAWVEYQKADGTKELYVALQGGTTADDIHNMELFEFQPIDFRHSVHYVLSQPDWMIPSIVDALDVAVFEALTYDVIYQWFMTAYPSEAEAALILYNAQIEKLKKRLQSRINNVSYIIPRVF